MKEKVYVWLMIPEKFQLIVAEKAWYWRESQGEKSKISSEGLTALLTPTFYEGISTDPIL